MFIKLLSVILLVTTLTACGGKGASKDTTKANILVLGGIESGIPGMTGGTKIFGYNNTTGETLNMTYNGQGAVTVSNGVWGFIAITWDGVTGNGNGQVLEGNVLCGSTPDMPLFGGDVAINIELSNGGCNDSFLGDAETKESNGEPKKFVPVKCTNDKGVYDDDDSNCIASVAESYRVSLPDGPFGGPGLTSRCIDQDTVANKEMTEATAELRIPLIGWIDESFPIRVELFDQAGCAGSVETYTIINPYAGWTIEDKAAKFEGGGSQGVGDNKVRFHNDPCINDEGNAPAPFSTAANEYIICNPVQFEGASGIEADLTGKYEIQRDLDFIGFGSYATAVVSGTFTGSIIGNGHTLSNITINATTPPNPIGIFSTIDGASGAVEVENIKLDNISITSFEGSSIGSLVGLTLPGTSIELIEGTDIDITTTGSTGPYYSIGGLIGATTAGGGTGSNYHAIELNNVTIDIGDNFEAVGGIIGTLADDNYLRISKINGITISSTTSGNKVGGAVGNATTANTEIYGVVINDLLIGSDATPLPASRSQVGGLIGNATAARVINNKVGGEIYSSAQDIGGLVGLYDGTGTSEFIGNITDVDLKQTTGSYLGGIIGRFSTTTGTVTFDANRSLGVITECQTYCGGLFGLIDAVGTAIINISKSYSRSNINSPTSSPTAHIGGLIGHAFANGGTVTINEVFSTGVITTTNASSDRIGGLIGYAQGSSVTDSYFTGTLVDANTGPAESGALVGYLDGGSFQQSYTTSNTTYADDCFGALINTPTTANNHGIGAAGGCSNYHTAIAILDLTNLTGLGANWEDIDSTTESTLAFEDLISSVGESYTGSFLDPIIITSPGQWDSIGDEPFLMGKTYQLGADIDFSNGCFTPIGSNANPFWGQFRGNNYTIMNINCSNPDTSEHYGLFRNIQSDTNGGMGSIEDLNFFDHSDHKWLYVENVHLTNIHGDVGVIAGSVTDNGTLDGGHNERFAFKVSKVSVTNSSATGNAIGVNAGGLFGSMFIRNVETRIAGLHFQGTVTNQATSSGATGGIVGLLGGNDMDTGHAGSIVDFQIGSFTGSVTGKDNTGGFAGSFSNNGIEVKDFAVVTSGVTGETGVGGFVGLINRGKLKRNFSKGDVTGDTNVGGYVGHANKNSTVFEIYNSYAHGDITATAGGSTAGCFIGVVAGTSPEIFNNYGLCSAVTGTTTSFFASGTFVLGGGTINAYAGPSDEVITGAAYVTYAQMVDPDHMSGVLNWGDPWMNLDGFGPPLFYWEYFSEPLGDYSL